MDNSKHFVPLSIVFIIAISSGLVAQAKPPDWTPAWGYRSDSGDNINRPGKHNSNRVDRTDEQLETNNAQDGNNNRDIDDNQDDSDRGNKPNKTNRRHQNNRNHTKHPKAHKVEKVDDNGVEREPEQLNQQF